jgi:RNA polymerase sigma factor (sigma-70 family)
MRANLMVESFPSGSIGTRIQGSNGSGDPPAAFPPQAADAQDCQVTPEPAHRVVLTPDQKLLAAQHLGLVRVHLRTRLHLRRRRRSSRRDFDELFQAGCLALVQAAARYDADRDGPFPAYALPRIRRAIHAAVLASRSLMRVPYGTACKRSHSSLRGGAPGRRFWPNPDRAGATDGSPGASTASLDSPAGTNDETIRHALRRRFECAVRQAADDVAGAARRDDATTIFARITTERILVSNTRERTSVRELATDLGLSSGQVCDYEQRLLQATRERLCDDAPALLLIRFGSTDPDGFDGLVDAGRRRRLMHAELRQFEQRFAAFSLAERARTLYALVERSTAGVGEVARNLFLLTLPNP